MKNSIISGVLSWGILTGFALGADQHWYQVDVTAGNATKTFYGSSTLDVSRMQTLLAAQQTIDLNELSDNFALAGEDKMSWRRLPDEKEALIPSRNVVSVIELSGDPIKIWAPHK